MVDRSVVPFSQRIRDRHQRWWLGGAPVEHKQIGGKLQGRAFAESAGCRVPELFALAESPDGIPEFEALPDRFVIKPTRGWSAKNVFTMDRGKNLLDGRTWSREAIVAHLLGDPDLRGRRVRFIVEEFLINWDGKAGIPLDYKFYMFGDRVAFIHVIERNSGRDLRANRHWFLDEGWTPLGFKVVETQEPERSVLPVPSCIDELLETVKNMGRQLNMFMRIDMYATTRGPVFGEFTPQPHGGNGFTPRADEWLGAMWEGLEGCQ